MKANPNSHTHCQAARAIAKTKAWQRLCLPNRTTKRTEKPTDEKEHRSDNITYTQAGVSCFKGQVSGKFKVHFFVANPLSS